jgi:PTH1 family peptidyl-tRNA hydrolase
MNRSGEAVRDAIQVYKDIEAIIIIQDDLDLDTGVIKIKKNGSSGGHRGVESIIQTTGTKDFIRVKIGIGRSDNILPEDYVLSSFNKDEQPIIKKAIEDAVRAVEIILEKGISSAQNIFN